MKYAYQNVMIALHAQFLIFYTYKGKGSLMKIVAIACLSSIFTLYAQPNFQLWNKHIVPVYYSIGYSTQEAAKKPMMQLRAGKWTEATIIDNKKPVIIAFRSARNQQKVSG